MRVVVTQCTLALTSIVLRSGSCMSNLTKLHLNLEWASASKLAVALLMVNLVGCSVLPSSSDKSQDLKPLSTIETSTPHTQAKNSGFGGTGRVLESTAIVNQANLRHPTILDSGFGGTGQTASGFGGTGMVGTLEQFGSIWINGIEVGLGQQTRISSNINPSSQQPMSVADLRIGQQVWFETGPNQDKTTTAEIHIFYPLGGKIDGIKGHGMTSEIMVNGQRILLCPQTVMPDNLKLQVGEWVRISGVPVYARDTLERSNAWQATLVEQSTPNEVWFNSVPDVIFSDRVNRVIMHSSWSNAYQAGEFSGIKQGLSAQPKIQVLGSDSNQPATRGD